MTPLKKWWCKDTHAGRARRKENEHAWKVPIEQIQANHYNLDIKNPNTEAAQHGDPDKLLKDYKKLQAAIATARNALKTQLAKALESTQP